MNGTYEDVARRAYELFLARGGKHGSDMDDWLEAERQLSGAGISGQRAVKPTAARQKRRRGATSHGG